VKRAGFEALVARPFCFARLYIVGPFDYLPLSKPSSGCKFLKFRDHRRRLTEFNITGQPTKPTIFKILSVMSDNFIDLSCPDVDFFDDSCTTTEEVEDVFADLLEGFFFLIYTPHC